jgi:hypothetical protein
MSESVRVKKRCFIKVPPALINPMVAQHQPVEPVTKIDLINKELNLLNEIHREQIIEKQIVSWLNSEQFLRRNFNYQSYQCIICNLTKNQILESHYLNKQVNTTSSAATASSSTNSSNTNESVATTRIQFYSEEMKTVVLTNHVLSHFNEYCYRCMSCKISWPDRTQLLKHSQECPNSQVVRTKTKYKLKANCRLQLKFYLQTYLDYWQHEKMLETRSLSCIENKLNFKIYLNDIIINKNLLMDASGRFNLNSINLDGKQILLKDDNDDENTTTTTTPNLNNNNEKINDNNKTTTTDDVTMKDDHLEKSKLLIIFTTAFI